MRWRGLIVPLLLLLAAEAAMRVWGSHSMALAAPSDVFRALVRVLADGSLLVATRDTLAVAFSGLAIGTVAGLALGIAFGLAAPLNRLMEVTVEAIRPIPSVALIPIAMLALGFGYRMGIAIVTFACVFPMLILTRAAIGGIEPRLFEVARALRLSFPQRVFKIILPAAFPRIMVAFRLAAGIALVVAVTVEIAANPQGLGHGILVAQQALDPARMLAYLLWIGIVGYALNTALVAAQHRLFGRAGGAEPA